MTLNTLKKNITGWIAISISAIFANLWAYWGIIENFHEGWYEANIWDNILMLFGQYLLVPIGFVLLGFISVRWNKIGAILHFVVACSAYFLFENFNAGFFLIAIPIIGLSFLYWFGNFKHKNIAYVLIIALPILIILGIGSFQLYKVSHRFNNHNVNAQLIHGNQVQLIWAPVGPGWTDNGTTWDEAKQICSHLSEDGTTISKEELNIWRLPTVQEAVASQVYRGKNAGGIWNNEKKRATYNHQPDKESPLWNVNSKTIYLWTSTEEDDNQAYIIVYNGKVFPRDKSTKADYLNFRAVK